MTTVQAKKIVVNAIREAGAAILALQHDNMAYTKKANDDVVTKADILADHILKSKLMTAFPDDGWLSEESVDDTRRLTCEYVWIVDPIDGTREYAKGMPEYAVSVARVKAGVPVMAAVFNPATNELFYAAKDEGAWLNDKQIFCHEHEPRDQLLLLASRSEYKRGEWDRFSIHIVKQVGSIAYKLALVAAGCADATFSLGPKSEWDIAAGVLLVTEAGGKVTDQYQQAFIFNREQIRVPGIVASSPVASKLIYTLISNKN